MSILFGDLRTSTTPRSAIDGWGQTGSAAGAVISTPPRTHECAPGVRTRVCDGLYGLPEGTVALVPPDPWAYPTGTVWACTCGQTWVSEGSPAVNAPGVCTFRREGRFERWRRERRSS